MLSQKDYSINRLFCRKKLLILTGFTIRNTKNKLLKCLVIWSRKVNNNSIVKVVNLEDTQLVIWEAIQIFNTERKIKWWISNRYRCRNKKWNNKTNKMNKIKNNSKIKWTHNRNLFKQIKMLKISQKTTSKSLNKTIKMSQMMMLNNKSKMNE